MERMTNEVLRDLEDAANVLAQTHPHIAITAVRAVRYLKAEREEVERLEAKLKAAEALPDEWREGDLKTRYPTDAPNVSDCAYELEDALKD